MHIYIYACECMLLCIHDYMYVFFMCAHFMYADLVMCFTYVYLVRDDIMKKFKHLQISFDKEDSVFITHRTKLRTHLWHSTSAHAIRRTATWNKMLQNITVSAMLQYHSLSYGFMIMLCWHLGWRLFTSMGFDQADFSKALYWCSVMILWLKRI